MKLSSAALGKLPNRPTLERLEDRLAPALYTVTTLVDENNGLGGGSVSLREALSAASILADLDTIDFAVTGTINLNSALPNVSGGVRILGPGAGNLTVQAAKKLRKNVRLGGRRTLIRFLTGIETTMSPAS